MASAAPPAAALAVVDTDTRLERLALHDDAESVSTPDSATSPMDLASSRPASLRATTESDSATLLAAHQRTERPRNRSPFMRAHMRSQSHASALAAPPMARARSLPIFSSSVAPARPASPLRASQQRPSPRRSFDESLPRSTTPSFMEIEIIAEDSELDITPRSSAAAPTATTPSILVPPPLHMASFQRSASSRRRPSSPLHYQYHPGAATTPPSPGANAIRFNEPFPKDPTAAAAAYASLPAAYASFPSTPTSLRSRSPSVSSLDTIPDSPDAEEEAQEEYRMAQLKAAADAAEADAEAEKNGARDAGSRASQRRERKRWSVCGAERRTDFEMETIWED